jgi:hypothetical protein
VVGATTSNIFGLTQAWTPDAEPGVLDTLLKYVEPESRVWTVSVPRSLDSTKAARGAVMTVGRARCNHKPSFVSLVAPREFKGFSARFYVTKLHSAYVLPSSATRSAAAKTGTKVARDVPLYIIWDTGTSLTYASEAFGEALRSAGYSDGRNGLQLRIGSSLHNVTLNYTAADLKFQGSSVLNVTRGHTLPNMESMFGGVSVMLAGIASMRGRYWEFDLYRSHLGIAALQ